MGRINIFSEPPGPNATQIIDRVKSLCYDSTFTYPLVIDTGEGCVVRDVDGNSFLDFTSNIGACPLGYSHPDVVAALAKISKNGAHKIAGQDFYCKEHADLAERFLSIVPQGFKTFFINSGAEAVENAIKVAYRRRMSQDLPVLPGVSCVGAFHGRTLGALSFTFSKPVQKAGFPELPAMRIKFCTSDGDHEIDAVDKILEENKVAFVISEVVQGEGGYNVASQKFVKNLRRATEERGVPLILDEVQSGMGRTGRWWAFEHYGVEPDIMSAAKALQVGATAFRKDLDPGHQGVLSSTWGGGNRVDMAVGAAVIDAIKRDRLLANANAMGQRLKKGIGELVGKKGGVSNVRGIGLMIGIEFDEKAGRDAALARLFKKGLLLLPAGQKAMRAIPPLVIAKEEIDEGIELMASELG
ncbi:MAG: aminotransferase class III-fold pyridoxal phosphate-dependent enzyme [Nitrososphaera sp.]|uniref:aminotransferase class III-fold pyridoxal phosphate-dependent enzyme n=1 Tax=Nitrososphaera sp. TaxID=1971748 RepID=UPI003D6F7858